MKKDSFINIILFVIVTISSLHLIQYFFNSGELLIAIIIGLVYLVTIMLLIYRRLK